MWGVPVEVLCRKHLAGEHVEMHMFVGTLRKGVSVHGYVTKGLVDCRQIKARHDALANEMLARGMNHTSEITEDFPIPENPGEVDVAAAILDLYHRCPACKANLERLDLVPR